MSFMPINPRPMLQELVNRDIVVRLKWGETEYKGRLVSIDSYMNIQLSNAQEFIDQSFTSDLGQILIRCNNVLWIKGADSGAENGGDVKMDG
ncbi:like-Sm domain-containing protein [Xylariomycetidae sp. FL2044]|nr:like-Sm domain-containing protein [Xylariomycetidae sp. FL2044]